MDKKVMRNMAKCLQCNEVLESKHRHDFVMCECPNQTFVDGGLDYLRRGGNDMTLIEELSEWEGVELSDYERVWREFWRDLIEEPVSEQVKKELYDYWCILQEVPKVYDAVTLGRFSKPNTSASVIIGEFEALFEPIPDEQ